MSARIVRPTLVMRGEFFGAYETKGFRDKETGEVHPNSHRVQMVVELPRENDTTKGEMIDLRAIELAPYAQFKRGDFIELPVGVFAPRERPGTLAWFLQKGSVPQLLEVA